MTAKERIRKAAEQIGGGGQTSAPADPPAMTAKERISLAAQTVKSGGTLNDQTYGSFRPPTVQKAAQSVSNSPLLSEFNEVMRKQYKISTNPDNKGMSFEDTLVRAEKNVATRKRNETRPTIGLNWLLSHGPIAQTLEGQKAQRPLSPTEQIKMFSGENAFKLQAARKEMADTRRLAKLDIGAAEKRVAELEIAAKAAKEAHTAVDADPQYTYWLDYGYNSKDEANEAYLAASNAAWAERERIDAELKEAIETLEKARRVQYSAIPGREDFREYWTKGEDIETGAGKLFKRSAGSVLSDDKSIPELAESKKIYDNLSVKERRVYSYLLAKDAESGAHEAEAYLELMQDTANARIGGQIADTVEDTGIFRPLATGVYGVVSGIDKVVANVKQAFSDERLPTSAMQYGSGYVYDDLEDVGPKVFGRSLGQIGYGATNLAGEMVPRVALGAVHPMLGVAGGAVSAYGNAYGQSLAQGYSEDQARSYATIRAAIDGTLQYAIGGYPQLGGGITEKVASRAVEHIDHALLRVAADAGIHGLGQGLVGALTTTLDPAVRNWLLDEDNDVNLLSEDGAYAFFVAFIPAAIARIPGAVRAELNRPGTALAVRKFGTDMPNYLTEDGTDYFDGVEDEAGARTRYRELARKNHPDMGGSEAVMKEINRQYEMRVNYYRGQAAGAQAAAAWEDPAPSAAQPNAGESASGTGLMLSGGGQPPARIPVGGTGPIVAGPGLTNLPNVPIHSQKTPTAAMLPEVGAVAIEDAEAPSTSIDTNPATHTPEQMALIKAYQGAVDKGLLQFYNAAKSGEKIAPYRMKPVSDRAATVIKNLLEKNVTGFATIFEPRIAEHIDRDHGEQGKADHSMKDPMDVARMQFVLDNFDSAVDGGTTDAYWEPAGNGKNRRARTIVFSKKVNGTYYVVEATPITKAQSVYIVSAYMSKAGTPHPTDATAPVFTAKPENVNVPASDVIIPQPPTGVNLQRALPGDIPADTPPGLRKLYRLAQEMSTRPQPREIPHRPVQQSPQEILSQLAREMSAKPQPREIPQRPVQQSPQEILSRLAWEMTQAPGGPLADRSDGDIVAMLDKISPTGEGLQSDTDNGILTSGAISGALNPEGKRARKHAVTYYGLVRKMTADVARIAKNTGYSEEQIQRIKSFLFLDKHDLGGGKVARFDPSYEIAQSWQRLIDGSEIQPHDLTLLMHEILESELMGKGYTQDEAHRITSKKYDYRREAEEYYGQAEEYS